MAIDLWNMNLESWMGYLEVTLYGGRMVGRCGCDGGDAVAGYVQCQSNAPSRWQRRCRTSALGSNVERR